MRRTLISLAVGLMLPISAAYADIASDVTAGLSPAEIVANAQAEGLTIEQIMQQIASADSSLIDAIVTAAIDAGLNPRAVVDAAAANGADRVAMEQTAILAGADPADVGQETAAGGPNQGQGQGQGQGQDLGQGLGIAPGQTGNSVSPPPFGSSGGGGGGGNPSAT